MSERKILREWVALSYDRDLLKESREKNGGRIVLQGVIQKAGTLNQNKRIYPHDVLRREVENYQKAIREGRAVGELDHPESSTVSLKNASHIIREAWWDGDDVCGKVEILSTPAGKIAEALLESGVKLGISSRGVGSTEKSNEGADIVQGDFTLVSWDLVAEPSTPGAFLHEGRQTIAQPRFTRGDRIFRALNDIVLK
jgi:hypothetical protein